MKLSMWDIYHALTYDDMLPMVESGSATIRIARLVSASPLKDDVVYVTNAKDQADSGGDAVFISNRDDTIVVHGVSLEQVFDDVSDAIDLFNDWERTIKGLAKHEDGLQRMLDASDCVLKAPTFVYAPDGHAFALSSAYGPDIHWHWAEILANRGVNSSRLRDLRDSINLPAVWKDSHPRTRPSVIGAHAYMHCSLKPNGYMAGHLVLFAFEKPFNRGLERIVDVLVKAMTKHMEHYYWLYSPTSQFTETIVKLLSGSAPNGEEVGLFLRAMRWNAEDAYRVYVIREKSSTGPVLLSQLFNDVSHRFPLAVALALEGELAVIENESRVGPDEKIAPRLSSILKGDFVCGVSMEHGGIGGLKSLLRQARQEALFCETTGVSRSFADSNRHARILEAFRKDDLIGLYVHPELARLKRYDEANDSHYFETLRAYVMASFHLSDAARYLGTHRNSLTYRLKRIREIIDMGDIDGLASNYDEEKLAYLIISFAIIDAQAAH